MRRWLIYVMPSLRVLLWVIGAVWLSPAWAGSPAAAIEALGDVRPVERTISLQDLGFDRPIVLDGADAQQVFYWPVPEGLRLRRAWLHVDARYAKATDNAARAGFSINGQPRHSKNLKEGDGRLIQRLSLTDEDRIGRFISLGVTWQSLDDLAVCHPQVLKGQGLTVSPQTRLHVMIDQEAVASIADAVAVLPREPVILIAGDALAAESLDAAWRVGTALRRVGKYPDIRALPRPGDVLDAGSVIVPAALREVPAFAALHKNSSVVLDDPAIFAASLVLGVPVLRADFLILDNDFRAYVKTAFDALGQQFEDDHTARDALESWQRKRFLAVDPDAGWNEGSVGLTWFGHQPVVAVAPRAASGLAGLLDSRWRDLLDTVQLETTAVSGVADTDVRQRLLPGLESGAAVLEVNTDALWSVNMPLDELVADSSVPDRLIMDLAVAPGATSAPPVASIYWNDILLSARRLRADGMKERLAARIPGYALGANNVIRLRIQRPLVDKECAANVQAFPVSVLPSSHVRLGSGQNTVDFKGVLPALAAGADLLVAESWAGMASERIGDIIQTAFASGISPANAGFALVPEGVELRPAGAFVAMDVALADGHPRVRAEADGSIAIRDRVRPWLDVHRSGVRAVLEVAETSEGHPGLRWSSVEGPTGPVGPFSLERGDAVLLGKHGALAWVDTRRPDASTVLAGSESAFYEWRSLTSWGVPITALIIALFLLLLLLSRRARRARRRATHA